MLNYLLKRVAYAIPIMLGVAFFCFLLVHIAPGDPLVAILPSDASVELQHHLMQIYGFDRPWPEQFARWLWRALHGDLGTSIATGRPVVAEVGRALGYSVQLALLAALIGFVLGAFFGLVAGYCRGSAVDRAASTVSMLGVSVPHYWLGMVLVIVFCVYLNWLPPTGNSDIRGVAAYFHWESLQYMILPALTMAVIPMGIIARTVRALVAETLAQEFIVGLAAKGASDGLILRHVIRNVAPTALAIMGLQLGYLLGGSILIETVFSWPGTGFLLDSAIFQRDLPLLQGTILVLALFFVLLNLVVDVLQTLIDPRIQRH